jgi:UDPglucose--hexose-1-phosphate uridylyltransferase
MFTVSEIRGFPFPVQLRTEHLTGHQCRISPLRGERGIGTGACVIPDTGEIPCPFCPERILLETPPFPSGERVCVGESVTFPNRYPFSAFHTVTVISRSHAPERFSVRQISNALTGQWSVLADAEGYVSINWNHLSSAGASMHHPHMQGIADPEPTAYTRRCLEGGARYRDRTGENYWEGVIESEREGPRHLFGSEVPWYAHPVPLGEKEIRAYLPVGTPGDAEPYIDALATGLDRVIALYRDQGHCAFNVAIRFDRKGSVGDFRAFLSIIARINPTPAGTSDSAFMERLHCEPVLFTIPEDLPAMFAGRK